MVETRIRIGHRNRRIIPHGERAGFVMGGAEPVPAALPVRNGERGLARGNGLETASRQHLVGLAIGKDQRNVFGRLIHGVPQLVVGRRGLNRHERARHAVFVKLARQRHIGRGVVRADFSDAAHRDDDLLVVHAAKAIDRVDVGYLLEKLGLGIRARVSQARRR